MFPGFFSEEMVETLVHEGSHHATAYTDDVVFQGKKVIKLAGPGKVTWRYG